jgi:hypothetical protein
MQTEPQSKAAQSLVSVAHLWAQLQWSPLLCAGWLDQVYQCMANVSVVLQPNSKHWQAGCIRATNHNCNIIYITGIHNIHNVCNLNHSSNATCIYYSQYIVALGAAFQKNIFASVFIWLETFWNYYVGSGSRTPELCTVRLSEGISKYQQLKKKSTATALNTVLASAHIQMT